MDFDRFTDSIERLEYAAFRSQQYEKCLQHLFTGIDYLKKKGKIDQEIFFYHSLIYLFITIKNYDLTKKYLRIISDLAAKTSDYNAKTWALGCHVKYYLTIEEYDSAIQVLNNGLLNSGKISDVNLIGFLYNALGDAYVNKHHLELAANAYQRSIKTYTVSSDDAQISVLYTKLAHVYHLMGNQHLNLRYNKMALNIRKKKGHEVLLASSYMNVGNVFLLLRQNDSAGYYFNKSLQLALALNHTVYIEVAYDNLKDFAISENRHKDALYFNQKGAEYRIKLSLEETRSEILIAEANRSISEIEASNGALAKETLIQDLEITNQKLLTIGFEVIFLASLMLIFIIDYLTRNNRKKKSDLHTMNLALIQGIKDNQEAKALLRQSEELHRFLAENSADVISLYSANLQRSFITNSCKKLYGFSSGEILEMTNTYDLIEPSFKFEVNRKIIEMIRGKKPTRLLYQAIRKNKSNFWAEDIINPVIDPATGQIKDFISVVRDYSQTKQFEDEMNMNDRQKEFLLHEIHNRVKNNFAILASLISMLPNNDTNLSLRESLTGLQLRIRTMSLVHEHLFKSKEISIIEFDGYLQQLCLVIAHSFNTDKINIDSEICKCQLSIDMALPLGLIVNELITNAFKYAFPDGRNGVISLNLVSVPDDKYCLSVSDNGVGLTENFTFENPTTMGSTIISILVAQLEGKLSVSNQNGACFQLVFPVKPQNKTDQ